MDRAPARPSTGQLFGLARSLVMYYGNPLKTRRMTEFYGRLIGPGDLCFDIGAHVGNRLAAWLRLGAEVVALEPQPACLWLLRKWFGRHPRVRLLDMAAGARPGTATLQVSDRTPTVSTLSQPWIRAVRRAPGFAAVHWETQVPVQVTTLDELIAEYGMPAFCKIDVEGFELEVLQGLSHAIPRLSFEYIPAAPEITLGCLARLDQLGNYVYNWSEGEQHRWQSLRRLTAHELRLRQAAWGLQADSGDIYAFRVDRS